MISNVLMFIYYNNIHIPNETKLQTLKFVRQKLSTARSQKKLSSARDDTIELLPPNYIERLCGIKAVDVVIDDCL